LGELLDLINAERVTVGYSALETHPSLMAAAQFMSEDMAFEDFIDDNCLASDGSTCTERLEREGYTVDNWNELNAWTHPTADDVMDFWMSNSSYRDVIRRCDVDHVGIGHVYQSDDQANIQHEGATEGPRYYYYWTLDVASPAN
jgi:uncharacterized protein YkwD